MVKIEQISMQSPLYQQEVELRTSILLSPIGLAFEDYLKIAPGREEQCEHFVAVVDHPKGVRVVGTAILFIDPAEPRSGKVQQVCVDKQRQGEGVGRKLMIAIEARAFGELGLEQLYCHAQISAMPFYEKLGWQSDANEFMEAGIPHRKMYISVQRPIEHNS